jgi:hypothetical protein
MKINKEQLKTIINEEIRAVLSEGQTWGDDYEASQTPGQKKAEEARRAAEEKKWKEEAENHPLRDSGSKWITNRGSYLQAAMKKINHLAAREHTKFGAKQPNENDLANFIVWKANNGFGIYGGSTKDPSKKDDYLMFHKKVMGQMPQWGDEEDVISDMEDAFLKALPPRNRPSRTLILFNKTLKDSIIRITDALVESDLVKKFEIYSVESLKKRFEANGGNFNKFVLQGVSSVTDVYDLDNLAELSKSDMRKLGAALKGSAPQKIAAFLSDPDGYGGLLAKKLKKRGFMDKAGSFVKGKGFNEGIK